MTKSNLILYIIIFLLSFIYRFFAYKFINIDSDEVMWSVMADNILRGDRHYVYFATQNYTGSMEAYILAIFQYFGLFGNSILRINSIIFGSLTSVLLFVITRKVLTDKISTNLSYLYASLSVVIYSVTTIANLNIHAKAWGNYVFIEFAFTLILLLFLLFLEKKKIVYIILIGLLMALSFWLNMQSLSFIVGFIFLFFLNELISLIKWKEIDKRSVQSYIRDYSFPFVVGLSSILVFYFMVRKRMFYDPISTLINKFGIDIGVPIDTFSIHLTTFIILSWVLTIIYIFSARKVLFKNTLIVSNLFFIGLYLNVHYNSFSRVSSSGATFEKRSRFIDTIIFDGLLGENKYWILGFILVAIIIYFYKKKEKFKFEAFNAVMFFFILFPAIFLVNSVPQMTPTPRYLIIWWPAFALCFVWSVSYINRLLPYKLGFIIPFLYLMPILQSQSKYLTTKDQSQSRIVNEDIQKIKSAGLKYCVGDYWDIGPIMYYSHLEIKCWTDKSIQSRWDVDYLDDYKEKYAQENYYLLD